jgi:hypothetical protein
MPIFGQAFRISTFNKPQIRNIIITRYCVHILICADLLLVHLTSLLFILDQKRMNCPNQQRKGKALRSKSMEMTLQKTDDISDGAVFAVAPTNHNGAQTTTAPAPPAFKSSLRSFLDGSEFMINVGGAAVNSSSDSATISREEDANSAAIMENAMQRGGRMARRCSCPSVGTYEPFDAADPTTWEENKKKKKIRKKSMSPTRSYVSRVSLKTKQGHREKEATEVKTSRRSRRTTAPMVSPYVLEQQAQADGERIITKEKGAYPPSSSALLKNDEPAPGQMVNNFLMVLEEINERKDKRKKSYHVRPSSIPEEEEHFGLVLREIGERKNKVETTKISDTRPPSDSPEEEEFMLVLKDIKKHMPEVRPTSNVAPEEEGFVMLLKDIKKFNNTEKKKKKRHHPVRRSEVTTREEEDQMMGNFLLVLEEINSGKKSRIKSSSTKRKKEARAARLRSISPLEGSACSMDFSSKSHKSSSTKDKRGQLTKEKSTRSARGSRSPPRHSFSSLKHVNDDEDECHHSGSRRKKNKDPSRQRRHHRCSTSPMVSTFVIEQQAQEDRERVHVSAVKTLNDDSSGTARTEPNDGSTSSTIANSYGV